MWLSTWSPDASMANHDPAAFEAAARDVGFLGIGFYPRSGFMHVDLALGTGVGRAVPGPCDCLRSGVAAGVAMLGAAGVEVAQTVLAETQSAIMPLVPYLDTLRWVFIAVALGGIAVTIYARLDDWKRGQR